jgi:hypothetical protein
MSHTGSRAVLTFIGPGGFDPVSSVMVYHCTNDDDLFRPQPSFPDLCYTQQHPFCSPYYVQGLYRQHTNSSAFHDFSPVSGRGYLAQLPGYYGVCVSASGRDSSGVLQDGVVSVTISRKDKKGGQSCPK